MARLPYKGYLSGCGAGGGSELFLVAINVVHVVSSEWDHSAMASYSITPEIRCTYCGAMENLSADRTTIVMSFPST
jgi:hypothetical protein